MVDGILSKYLLENKPMQVTKPTEDDPVHRVKVTLAATRRIEEKAESKSPSLEKRKMHFKSSHQDGSNPQQPSSKLSGGLDYERS